MLFNATFHAADIEQRDKKRSLFMAKKMLPEYVFDTSRLEGNPITFPEVQTLMEGITVGGHKISDMEQVLNILNAWLALFEMIDQNRFEVSQNSFNKINSLIARDEALEWGCFRTGNVNIAGTKNYKCPPADELPQIFNEELPKIKNSSQNPVDFAIRLFLWASLNQFYWDGNKRTARIISNGILLNEGIGVFNISATDILEFNTKMLSFYENKNADDIIRFLSQKCIKVVNL